MTATSMRTVAVVLGIAVTLFHSSAHSDEIALDFQGEHDSSGAPQPWTKMVFKNSKGSLLSIASFEEVGVAARLHSKKASFSLNREVSIDAVKYRQLNWSWQGVKLPAGGDVRKNGLFGNKNDQALQLIVLFKGNRAISYIWDTSAPVGHWQDDSPPFIGVSLKAVVVESGPDRLGEWRRYERDLVKDYQTYHGGAAPAIVGVRLQSNSQHTGTSGDGYFASITFQQ